MYTKNENNMKKWKWMSMCYGNKKSKILFFDERNDTFDPI